MKLKYLFFYIASSVFLNSYNSLLADKSATIAESDAHNHEIAFESRALVENIIDLLSSGCSPDQVVTMFDTIKAHPDDHQRLVSDIHNLLDKNYSKREAVNIFIQNKELEKYYAHLNFKEKLRTFAGLATAVTVLYLLYHYTTNDTVATHESQESNTKQLNQKIFVKKANPKKIKRSKKYADNYNIQVSYDYKLEAACNHQFLHAIKKGYLKPEDLSKRFDVSDFE